MRREIIEAVRSAMWTHHILGHGCDEQCTKECESVARAVLTAAVGAYAFPEMRAKVYKDLAGEAMP